MKEEEVFGSGNISEVLASLGRVVRLKILPVEMCAEVVLVSWVG